MFRTFIFSLIAIFSIFIGSQLTEGVLLLPYWKSLSAAEFYSYYSRFGPTIGKFYSILTIIAVLIPLVVSIYCYCKKSQALNYSIVSTFFAVLVIVVFYLYFKGTNQQFYEATFNDAQLKFALKTWGQWHWLRMVFEFLSLIFLIQTFNRLLQRTELENGVIT